MRALFVSVLCVASVSAASEVEVTEKQVPKAVLAAVAKKYPAAKPTGFSKELEAGKTTYEVRLAEGTRKLDIDVSPSGELMAEEETIALEAAPEAVRKAFAASKYAGWEVKHVERAVQVGNEDAPTFEVLVVQGKQRAEIAFDKDGKLQKP